MIFHSSDVSKGDAAFTFLGEVRARARACFSNSTLKEFWCNFSYGFSSLEVEVCEEYIFSIGDVAPIPAEDCAYTINIQENGVCLAAKNDDDLRFAYMTLLDTFSPAEIGGKGAIVCKCRQIRETPLIQNRMVHFCIFPETELWQLRRFVRFCAALKYTHVILEFWGMLKYDCMQELAWEHAFDKEQIRAIVKESHNLGLKIIPMFNHWGHASASRLMQGKHVVLDQNPSLQNYFSEDGWCWNIKSEKVRLLLRKVRRELIDLCGDCEYFHIGCDEAYGFEFTKENMDSFCDFVNEIAEDLRKNNRRAIVWGDMLIARRADFNRENSYYCGAPSIEAEEYLSRRLSKDIVIADWQYCASQYPIETASVFVKNGFECLLCPYDMGEKCLNATHSTVINQNLKGILHTTWHTLSSGTWAVTFAAIGCFPAEVKKSADILRTQTAACLRKAMPAKGNYEKSGWAKKQVDERW